MEMTPQAPQGRQVVTGYGDGRIRVSGVAWEQPVLVLPETTIPWSVAGLDDLSADSLARVVEHKPAISILLIGCGKGFRPLPAVLKAHLRAAGISADPMDTGAACRTYNVLIAEDRRVAAALLPV